MADLTTKQFAAALAKYGMRDNDGPLGYVRVNDTLSVCKYNAGSSRRAQLAYLLRARDEDAKRRERFAAMCAHMENLIDCRREGDRYQVDHAGRPLITIGKVENLTPEQAARVVLLLREIRAEAPRGR